MKNKFLKLIMALVLTLGTGFIGSLFTNSQINSWYKTINKPTLVPPDYVFPIVWTTLFILMGISFYLILINNTKNKTTEINIFIVQLIINILWSVYFFTLHKPLIAFFVIIALWLLILANIIIFYKKSRLSAYLLIPYIVWVSFATYLNYAIVILN
jgi:translocator protein